MSFFERIRKIKGKSPIVFVKFPSENPALELQIQRVTPSEIAGIHADAIAATKQDSTDDQREKEFQVAMLNGMIAQLKKNTKSWKAIEADCPAFSNVERDAFFECLDLSLKGDLRKSYNEAAIAEASADFLEPNSEKPSKSDSASGPETTG